MSSLSNLYNEVSSLFKPSTMNNIIFKDLTKIINTNCDIKKCSSNGSYYKNFNGKCLCITNPMSVTPICGESPSLMSLPYVGSSCEKRS